MSTPSSASRDIRGYFPVKPAPAPPPKMSTSPTGTSDEEDPLLSAPLSAESARTGAPGPQSRLPSEQANEPTPPPVRSRIAVVLAASPSKNTLSVTSGVKREVGAAGSVPSGLPPPPNQQTATKETPVPLPKIPHYSVPSTPTSTSPATQSRGRPKGWKPGMSYSVMRGNGPPGARTRQVRAKAPPPGFAKRRRRQQKPPSPPPAEIYRQLNPQFVEFLCEWAGCKAELHNLDTLRRHIYVAHGRGDQRTCRWGKCGNAELPEEFLNTANFEDHIEEAHLVPFAWHIGDGPRNSEQIYRAVNGLEGEAPDFLRDAEGNQVTPSVRDQEVEDLATWRANRRRLKELLIQRNENLPDEESDEPDDDLGQA